MAESKVEFMSTSLHNGADSMDSITSSKSISDHSNIDYYCSLFGAFPPPSPAPLYRHMWFWCVKFFYLSYALSVMVFLMYEFFSEVKLTWILFNLILSVKCITIVVILYQMMRKLHTVRNNAQYDLLAIRAYDKSLLYYRPVTAVQFVVYVVWSIVRYGTFPFPYWVLFMVSLVFGTYGFVCHKATATLMCIMETMHLQDKLTELELLAREQKMVKGDFANALKILEDKKSGIYRINDLVLWSVLINTVVLIVLLFKYQSTTADRTYFFSLWYVVYVITMLFWSDICYLFVVLPMMSRCNDMMRALIAEMALTTWEPNEESNRRDVLLAMVAAPFRVKFFGIEMTKDEMMRRLVGLAIAVLSVMAKYMQKELR